MPTGQLWDIFCTVIDNHGDLGVCWRLARQLRDAGQQVRLWVDNASALAWMAPAALRHEEPGIEIKNWAQASRADTLQKMLLADVWIEAFGCRIPEAFVAHFVELAAATCKKQPVWINLEYLSAESWVPRMHGLPSPVMSGPAKGWTQQFFYPGFTPDTGGLLREKDLMNRHDAFASSGQRSDWRAQHAPDLAPGALLISLFCYEPAALSDLLAQLANTPHHLLVTPGRPLAAVKQALNHKAWSQKELSLKAFNPKTLNPQPAQANSLHWRALPYTTQDGFDDMLWACDLNLVRGEDSLVRALWAGQPFVWHIYPQDDNAHHAKLEAFLDWLQAPLSLRWFHRVWNGVEKGELPHFDLDLLSHWKACTHAARQRLENQEDLLSQLRSQLRMGLRLE